LHRAKSRRLIVISVPIANSPASAALSSVLIYAPLAAAISTLEAFLRFLTCPDHISNLSELTGTALAKPMFIPD
jgi:hypothetical protein